MENQIIKNKRSVYIWVVLTLVILGIISYVFAVILGVLNIKIFLEHNILIISTASIFSIIFDFINLCILVVYFYKLYGLKDDVVKWTNLFFYFFIFSSSLGLFFDFLKFSPVLIIQWAILMTVITLVWFIFVNYLKKISKIQIGGSSIILNNQEISSSENVENKEVIQKTLSFKLWIKKHKVILIIIFSILILIFGPSLFMVTKSKIECGENAKLVDDKKGGYYCSYYFINEPENNKCIDAEQFCGLKGKIDKNSACGFDSFYGKNVISVKKDGVTYLKDGPLACNYCCGQ